MLVLEIAGGLVFVVVVLARWRDVATRSNIKLGLGILTGLAISLAWPDLKLVAILVGLIGFGLSIHWWKHPEQWHALSR